MEKWYLKLSGVLILVILLIVVIFSVRKEKEEYEPKTTETSLVYNEYQTKKSAINYYKIKDGILYGRGRNTEGQLGLGKIEPLEVDYNYDVEIAKNVIHVDASNNGTVVYITENGELYGIGNNSSGQLGQSIEGKNRLSDEVNISTPVLIAKEVRYALVGINFTMYLTEDDKLYVLGDNANGQLGNGEAKPVRGERYTSETTPYSAEPVLVMENVRYIDCGLYNLAAITKRGDLYMWGDNSFGEMGNERVGNKMPTASIDVVSEPYLVMKNIRKVTIEEHTVYAETMQGEVYTWGDCIVEPKKVESEDEKIEQKEETLNTAVNPQISDNTQNLKKDIEARKIFAVTLRNLLNNNILPDGREEELAVGEYSKFGIGDVDNDGKEELILLYESGVTAYAIGYILGYDTDTKEIHIQLDEYPYFVFLENGNVKALASHNQTWGKMWPYSLYQYNTEKDVYELAGIVWSEDKAIFEVNGVSERYPDYADISGTGTVYYIDEETWGTTPTDEKEYLLWLKEQQGNSEEVKIEYLAFTEENILKIE